MKILLGCDSYTPNIDGVIICVKNIYNCLKKLGHEVKIIVPYSKELKKINNPDIILVPAIKTIIGWKLTLPIFNYYPLYKQLKKFKPDIICSHSPFVIGSLITKFGRKHNIPVVATFHTHFYDEFLKITHSKFISKCLLKSIVKVFNNANYLHVLDPLNTSTIREYAINDFGKNIIFCDNGTEYKDVPNHNEIKTFINSKYNIADNDFVFSFVGRFVQCKNIDLIIKAATKINNDHVKYFLVGDGVEMKRLRNLVSANKLNDKFIFTGIIDDRALLQKIFIRTDCNILISDFDTFPLTILEAAASKTPSLMLKNYTSLINDSINGYLVDDMKIDTVKDKINFILNDKNINLVSANAFAEIFKPRTWERKTEYLVSKYEWILKHNK